MTDRDPNYAWPRSMSKPPSST